MGEAAVLVLILGGVLCLAGVGVSLAVLLIALDFARQYTKRPFFIIERDDRGINSAFALDSPPQDKEQPQPPGPAEVIPLHPNPDEIVPDLDDEGELETLGERTPA